MKTFHGHSIARKKAEKEGNLSMNDWNSAQYVRFRKERTQPAIDLAARIGLDAPASVLDVGCGPGNSTAILQERFPYAKILGVDSSPNMLERARKEHPELEFRQLDVSSEAWDLDGAFDLVFSNACIHWVPDHHRLLPKMMSVLNSGGMLAVQVPITSEEPMHQILHEISGRDAWRGFFPSPARFYTLRVEEYDAILSGIAQEYDLWTTVYVHRLRSHDDIIAWYQSTGLKPYLSALDAQGQRALLTEVRAELEKRYPIQPNGNLLFYFPRLFFTARK